MDDLKAMVEKLTAALQKNGDLKTQFQKNPIAAAEKILGVKLPAEIAGKVIDGVKAKLNLNAATDAIDKLKKLF